MVTGVQTCALPDLNNWLFRVAYLAGGLCLMVPETMTDIVGLAIVLGVTALNRVAAKRDALNA